jgi:hypothetical protein
MLAIAHSRYLIITKSRPRERLSFEHVLQHMRAPCSPQGYIDFQVAHPSARKQESRVLAACEVMACRRQEEESQDAPGGLKGVHELAAGYRSG